MHFVEDFKLGLKYMLLIGPESRKKWRGRVALMLRPLMNAAHAFAPGH